MPVRVLAGDLLEHLPKVHVHAGCALDECFEFLESWSEGRLGGGSVGVEMGGDVLEVGSMDAVVGGEPGPGSFDEVILLALKL